MDKIIKTLIKKIKEYDTIIIHRHTRPDLDALGSQLGLASAIKYNFPKKKVYVVGDESAKYSFIGKMDEVNDELYKDALVIIVDVAVKSMVSDDRYSLAKEVFVIDHHNNECDITPNWICNSNKAAAAEFITEILISAGYKFNKEIATYLLAGIITDSGRFMYGHDRASTLRTGAFLLENGADDKYIYSNMYVESLESKKMTVFLILA